MRSYTSGHECIELSDKALSSGGEGEIHSVLSKPARFNNVCVKIYFKAKRTKSLENKIKYMVANPPCQTYSSNYLIGWPLEVIYDIQKNFIGFVMPLAYDNSKPLIVLTAKNISKKLDPTWAYKYDRKYGAASMIARLKLICNIAIPIHLLHITGKYILTDFKPENILVTSDGKVTLVDMDSVQITENNRLLFKGTAMTPNYIPPEYYTKNIGKNIKMPIAKSWDYFAIAVVFYQIIFGLHPYVVVPLVTQNDDSNEIFQNIARNLFPFGANASMVKSYPALHNNFANVPKELQQLFRTAFSDNADARPSPEMWVKSIRVLVQNAPPQPLTGMINVHTFPSAASVKIDGNYIGTTPIRVKANAGHHMIELSYNGQSLSYENVKVEIDETTYIDARLDDSVSSQDTASQDTKSDSTGFVLTAIFTVIAIVFLIILIL